MFLLFVCLCVFFFVPFRLWKKAYKSELIRFGQCCRSPHCHFFLLVNGHKTTRLLFYSLSSFLVCLCLCYTFFFAAFAFCLSIHYDFLYLLSTNKTEYKYNRKVRRERKKNKANHSPITHYGKCWVCTRATVVNTYRDDNKFRCFIIT